MFALLYTSTMINNFFVSNLGVALSVALNYWPNCLSHSSYALRVLQEPFPFSENRVIVFSFLQFLLDSYPVYTGPISFLYIHFM